MTSNLTLPKMPSPLPTPHPRSLPPHTNLTSPPLPSNANIPQQRMHPLGYYSLPSSPLIAPAWHYIEQPPNSPTNDQSSKTTTAPRPSKNAGIANLASSLNGATKTLSTKAPRNEMVSSKSSPSLSSLTYPSNMLHQPQYFIFPEVPTSKVELTPKENVVTLNMEANLSTSYGSGCSSAGSLTLPGFQVLTSPVVNSSHTPRHPSMCASTSALSQPHTLPPVTPPSCKLYPLKISTPLQLHDLQQATNICSSRVPDSPLVVSFQEGRQGNDGIFTMDSILEEASSDTYPSSSCLLKAKKEYSPKNCESETRDSTEDDKIFCKIRVSIAEDTNAIGAQDDHATFTDASTVKKTDRIKESGMDNPCIPTIHPDENKEPYRKPRQTPVSKLSSSQVKEGLRIKSPQRKPYTKPGMPPHNICKQHPNTPTTDHASSIMQLPLKQMPLALSLNQTVCLLDEDGNEGNKSAQLKQTEMVTVLNRRPIPVSKTSNAISPRSIIFQDGETEKHQQGCKDLDTLYVVKSPSSLTKVPSNARSQFKVSHCHQSKYQQTDF